MRKKLWILGVVLIVLLLVGTTLVSLQVVHAQGRAFTLTHSVIGSGGMGGSAGGYTINSTLGQPVAGTVSGGDTTLTSGFWGEAFMEWLKTFLPIVLR